MNRIKLLSIMPYVLGILILILVAVVILTELGGNNGNANIKQADVAEEDAKYSKNNTNVNEDKQTVQQDDGQGNTQEDSQIGTDSENASEGNGEAAEGDGNTQGDGTTDTEGDTGEDKKQPVVDMTFGYTFEKKADYVDTKDGVNLRLGASTETQVVAFLELGKRIERTGYNEEWTRLLYDGQECYIATRLVLRVVDSLDTEVPTENTTPEALNETDDKVKTADNTDADKQAADDTLAAENAEVKTADNDKADTNKADNGSADSTAETLSRVSFWGAGAGKLVCIDPGHQKKGNNDKEPDGPGSSNMKKKVSYGTAGVSTGLAEYKLNLTVSLALKEELEARGYEVIMTRTTHDVDISNVERSEIANDAGADAFVRIHANGSDNKDANGIETICMTEKNPYNAELFDASYKLSECILDNMVERTGAKKRYVMKSDSYTGINWCKVPVTIVEMGFMSNPSEDKMLSDPDYQHKLVIGIADGLDAFFK